MTRQPFGSDDATVTAGSWYLVFVLTLAYTISFIDRQVLNLLVGPIKAQFDLSDTRLSMLQGLAFTISYITMSPIFGRWTDVGNRRNILGIGIILWSLGTAGCGLARNFAGLFAGRLAVGGAEACLTPACWSMISDSFPARTIPRAFSIYLMGPYLGGGLALIFGGILLKQASGWKLAGMPVIGGLAPWQLVFILVGLPGLIVAILLFFVREPPRREVLGIGEDRVAPDWSTVRRSFAERRAFYVPFYLGMALLVITLYGFPAWMPAVLIRQFGAPVSQVGIQFGMLVLIAGSLGVLTGPLIAGQLTRAGRTDALLLVPLTCTLLLIPTGAALFLVNSYNAALAVATLATFLYSVPQALAASALQIATPSRMRGMASALYVFAVSISGLALAPTIIALITDRVFGDETKVGSSLAITVMVACGLGSFCLWRARRAYRRLIDL